MKLGRPITHGLSDNKFYGKWMNIIQRTTRTTNQAYLYYGGRGIKVCDRWLEFKNFFNDMADSYYWHCGKYGARNTTIERKDNNKGYNPQNCIWATRQQQVINRRYQKRNISKILGVTWEKGINKWVSRISRDGKCIRLGKYKDINQAKEARMLAECLLFIVNKS